MIKELDLIILKKDVKEHGLQAGDIGTVVYVSEKAVEAEFIAASGETIAVLTLLFSEIDPFSDSQILHARQLTGAV